MKHYIPGPLPDTPRNLIRRAGYGEKPGYKGQISYTRRFTNAPYPQFHLYFDLKDDGIQLNLHLDQKKSTYSQSSHAHSADYEGPQVEREMARLVQFINTYSPPTSSESSTNMQEKKGFWGTIFG